MCVKGWRDWRRTIARARRARRWTHGAVIGKFLPFHTGHRAPDPRPRSRRVDAASRVIVVARARRVDPGRSARAAGSRRRFPDVDGRRARPGRGRARRRRHRRLGAPRRSALLGARARRRLHLGATTATRGPAAMGCRARARRPPPAHRADQRRRGSAATRSRHFEYLRRGARGALRQARRPARRREHRQDDARPRARRALRHGLEPGVRPRLLVVPHGAGRRLGELDDRRVRRRSRRSRTGTRTSSPTRPTASSSATRTPGRPGSSTSSTSASARPRSTASRAAQYDLAIVCDPMTPFAQDEFGARRDGPHRRRDARGVPRAPRGDRRAVRRRRRARTPSACSRRPRRSTRCSRAGAAAAWAGRRRLGVPTARWRLAADRRATRAELTCVPQRVHRSEPLPRAARGRSKGGSAPT